MSGPSALRAAHAEPCTARAGISRDQAGTVEPPRTVQRRPLDPGWTWPVGTWGRPTVPTELCQAMWTMQTGSSTYSKSSSVTRKCSRQSRWLWALVRTFLSPGTANRPQSSIASMQMTGLVVCGMTGWPRDHGEAKDRCVQPDLSTPSDLHQERPCSQLGLAKGASQGWSLDVD